MVSHIMQTSVEAAHLLGWFTCGKFACYVDTGLKTLAKCFVSVNHDEYRYDY